MLKPKETRLQVKITNNLSVGGTINSLVVTGDGRVLMFLAIKPMLQVTLEHTALQGSMPCYIFLMIEAR